MLSSKHVYEALKKKTKGPNSHEIDSQSLFPGFREISCDLGGLTFATPSHFSFRKVFFL